MHFRGIFSNIFSEKDIRNHSISQAVDNFPRQNGCGGIPQVGWQPPFFQIQEYHLCCPGGPLLNVSRRGLRITITFKSAIISATPTIPVCRGCGMRLLLLRMFFPSTNNRQLSTKMFRRGLRSAITFKSAIISETPRFQYAGVAGCASCSLECSSRQPTTANCQVKCSGGVFAP